MTKEFLNNCNNCFVNTYTFEDEYTFIYIYINTAKYGTFICSNNAFPKIVMNTYYFTT